MKNAILKSKTNNTMRKMSEELGHFTKGDHMNVNEHMESCSPLLAVRVSQ